jgi:hypothetical protein
MIPEEQDEKETEAAAVAAAAADAAAAAARPLGFVIDGFPATAAEAMALERALTGLDTERADLIVRRCSGVAPPAPQELAAHAEPEYVSGRGLHSSTFLLNLSAFCWIGGVFRGCLGRV